MIFAMISFPVPVSPVIKMLTLVGDTFPFVPSSSVIDFATKTTSPFDSHSSDGQKVSVSAIEVSVVVEAMMLLSSR